jgi:hypothetical protein
MSHRSLLIDLPRLVAVLAAMARMVHEVVQLARRPSWALEPALIIRREKRTARHGPAPRRGPWTQSAAGATAKPRWSFGKKTSWN